ncbi:response regulator [Candidatus Uhrbacteria bacterium]|nr:response regulator [Candidatus Uhrbacteria bacterium]
MQSNQAAPGGKKLKVLIVEDDRFLQKILLTKFEKEGYEVRGASDGEEAMQALLAETPNLVLLDLILPKMSGFELLSEMKTSDKMKQVPVIVLSNLSQEEDLTRARELGAIDFLTKADISIHAVVERVKESYAKYLSKAH